MKTYNFIEEKVNEHHYDIIFRNYIMKIIHDGSLFPWKVVVFQEGMQLPKEEQIKQKFKTYAGVKSSLINYMRARTQEDFIVQYCDKSQLTCECGTDKLKLPKHSYWCQKYVDRD